MKGNRTKTMKNDLDTLCINTIRMLCVDAVQQANSGHPGMPMGAAAMAYTLWTRFLRHNPLNPGWPNRDRFVLSAGHGSMLLYSLLHLTGYDLPLDELKNFRQWGSRTPGHPEYRHTPGVETTTGPLGQGFANGVGMAIAEQFLAARFNKPGYRVVDHYTYGIVSDGDLMEGISHEAASLAGHLGLGKLIYLYDDNHISIEGSTEIAFTEDRTKRFEAYNWHVQEVGDGNDLDAIAGAIEKAQKETGKPSIIAVRTHIGFGSPNKKDTPSAHGEPLGQEEVLRTRENLGWPRDVSFFVPEDASKHFLQARVQGKALEQEWINAFQEYSKAFPDLADTWHQWMNREFPRELNTYFPSFTPEAKGPATRAASGKVLNALASPIPNLVGGSADLAPSNKTLISGESDFRAGAYTGRNIRFGVREHGMGSIMNGMALHGGLIPYGGTFLIFSDYMKPAIRLAAMMGLQIIYVFTHDSIGLGEDGPTHQPIEQLASLRSIPNLVVIRPADANEVAQGWRTALLRKNGPTALALTRQGLPVMDRSSLGPAESVAKGGYILKDTGDGKPDIILMASGSEVPIALEGALELEKQGIKARVVNMASWELFDEQPEEYRESVLPQSVTARVSIEAGCSQGWQKYTGSGGVVLGIDHFGASAPFQKLYEEFGITAKNLVKKALHLLGH
ncbi:MAG: transketolase [Deltaproteobacteria bacterium]|nr:MAG: transketolase [Deltaproteobacteria bacterium]